MRHRQFPLALLLIPSALFLLGNGSCSPGSGGWDDPGASSGDSSSDGGTSTTDWGEEGTSGPGGLLSVHDGECEPIAWLTCGESTYGDTSNPDSGHTRVIDGYPGIVGNYNGPEIAWAYYAEASEEVVWRLVDPHPTDTNHDLFVLHDESDTCRADAILERGFNEVRFDAEAGETYFLVLDGYFGNAGPFETELDCGVWGSPGGGSGGGAPALPGSCAQLQPHWDTDVLEPIARCTSIAQPAVPESTWTGETLPELSLVSADLCLARSTWGYNDQDYFVFGGHIYDDYPYGGGPRLIHATAFVGYDGDSHGIESASSVDIRETRLGAAFIDDGDLVTEVLYDKLDETLLFRQGTDAYGAFGWTLHYAALLNCESLQ